MVTCQAVKKAALATHATRPSSLLSLFLFSLSSFLTATSLIRQAKLGAKELADKRHERALGLGVGMDARKVTLIIFHLINCI